jgi:hypothetical protein
MMLRIVALGKYFSGKAPAIGHLLFQTCTQAAGIKE